jgi:hypothetical protein
LKTVLPGLCAREVASALSSKVALRTPRWYNL